MAAGAAVAVSFVILTLFWRHDVECRDRDECSLMQGAIPGAIVACCQAIGVGALALIVSAGLFGNQNTFKNIAPISIWIIWWVGFSFFCAFVGNVWGLINPWVALFDVGERLARPWAKGLSLQLPYPRWLGSWPACAFLLLFAWLELVAPGRDVPRNVAIAIVLYSIVTWAGFAAFGRELWLSRGEVFSVLFDLFGRFAPLQFTCNGRWHWSLRPFAAGLLTRAPLPPSMTAFTLLLLGTLTVDGFMETPLWVAAVEGLIGNPGTGVDPKAYMLIQSALLVAGPLFLAALYLTAIAPDGEDRASARFGARRAVRAVAGPDRDRLSSRALFFAAGNCRSVYHSACLRSLRLRLGFVRHNALSDRYWTRGCAFPLVPLGECHRHRAYHCRLDRARHRIQSVL